MANIDSHGNVYPCQFARSGEFLVGNIRDQLFSRIWGETTNPVLERCREKQARGSGAGVRGVPIETSAGEDAASRRMR